MSASAAAVVPLVPAGAQRLGRTPGQILGPYYPVVKPRDRDIDLTSVDGRSGRAAGRIIRVAGRVLDQAGMPMPGVELEIWQADTNGHYAHPSDKSAGARDPNFQGYATLRSRADGSYSFTTIRPGPYRDDGAGGMRAPHIHFQVTGPANRLVTQMYFEGEALNGSDRILAFAQGNRERLIARVASGAGPGAMDAAEWDIIVRNA
ncbi:MAG TPA: protocatechuate 3,4-dioxygenase [Sphingomicrobium sp.]|jgi:protocatechuate 3,4-dioxygenase beta subunit